MIYCVADEDVVTHLAGLGYELAVEAQDFRLFQGADGRRLTLRRPNVNGHLPEAIVNDAFDAARLDLPRWDVFWCD